MEDDVQINEQDQYNREGYAMKDYFRTKPALITCGVLKAIRTAAKGREGKSSGLVRTYSVYFMSSLPC